jgi:L-2,4-diaminobutyrate transaminase
MEEIQRSRPLGRTKTAALEELDRQRFLHPFQPLPAGARGDGVLMREGRGVWLRDVTGREYLDALSGLWCVNVGYGREEIAEAMASQARRLAFYHSFSGMGNEPAVRLADRLLERTGRRFERVFFGLSGSDANETQLKLAWLYHHLRGRPGKRKVIARRRAYHGTTLGAASATGLPAIHAGFGLPVPGFVHVRTPHAYREAAPGEDDAAFVAALVRDLEETLAREGAQTVAAFIAEPVMGAGGVLVPPRGYFEAIQPVLRENDVLFIADEVICAFGRLGRWLGGERFGIEPDLVTLAKGLTSGYAPLSACLVGPRVEAVLEEGGADVATFAHGYTYTGHPVSAAAALANLALLEEEKLLARADSVGAVFQARLRERVADHPLVGEVRGVSMIAAVELVADRATRTPFDASLGVGRRMHRLLLDEGLVCRVMGDALGFAPALVASEDELDEMIARFARGLDRLAGELAAEGRRVPAPPLR